MASGRDILAEEILAKDEPDFEQVSAVLPPIDKGAYCFLSGASSMESVIVDAAGNIYPERYGKHQPGNRFSPASVDSLLGAEKPKQRMLNRGLPVLLSRHEKDNSSLELLDLDVTVDASSVTLSGKSENNTFELPVVLYIRFKDKLKKEDILKGNNVIDKIFDDRIILKPGLRSFSVTIKN
jgi:hypothetical protein